MALASREIQKDSNTFYVIKLFGKYFVYESFFGNVVKIYGQSAYGSLNRVSPLAKYMRNDRNTDKIKIFYMEANLTHGLIQKRLPNALLCKKGTPSEYKETKPKFITGIKKPHYDLLIKENAIYYCIEVPNGKYILYDYDMGNPLMSDVEDQEGNKYLIKSWIKKNTKKIIESLPSEATVYSLKVDANFGLIKGKKEFEKLSVDIAKKQTEKISEEKNKDSTAMKVKKDEIRIKKRDELASGK